jgi:hypothetical protein
MSMTASNPIQQRIELLAEKWNDAVADSDAPVIRFHARQDEDDMVDAFSWYMLSDDAAVEDIAIILDPIFTGIDDYSRLLLRDLAKTVDEWNYIPKGEDVDFVKIAWEPDFSQVDKHNPAALFVRNFNRLAEEFDLEDDVYIVAVIKTMVVNNRKFADWLRYAIEAGISPKVKFLVSDTDQHPLFEKVAAEYKDKIVTIRPELDMPNAMIQIAAMGDPKEPATAYRQAFVRMMAAMEQRKEQDALRYGKECITLAEKHVGNDPYWITQLVVVYSALSNDRAGYKKLDSALEYAEHALEAALSSRELLEYEVSLKLVAQALMNKGALLCMKKDWDKAADCFQEAAGYYVRVSDYILGVEAYRMTGFSSKKAGQRRRAVEALAEGLRFGRNMQPQYVPGSTLAGVVELLLDSDYESSTSYDEIEEIASGFFGDDWRQVIREWKTLPQEMQQDIMPQGA